MPALLVSPLARWAVLAAFVAALAGWGALERSGRQAAALRERAAIVRAEAAEARIRHMEARNAIDDAVRRERDPVGELRREFSRD